QNNASRASYRQHFVYNLFHQLFGIVTLRDLTVTNVSQRRDRVQRAITEELHPKFAFNVIREAKGYTGANDNTCKVRSSLGTTDHHISARRMSRATTCLPRHRYVNDSWHGRHVRCSANLIPIIHAVLQTNHCRIGSNEWRHFSRGSRRIISLDAQENERALSNSSHLDRRPSADSLPAF